MTAPASPAPGDDRAQGAPGQGRLAIERMVPWLAAGAPEGDAVISSRVRLARNLAGTPFLPRATPDQRRQVYALCRDHLSRAGLADRVGWIDVHALPQSDRTLLIERHLVSREHAKGGAGPGADWPRGLCVTIPDERLSVMVNEEDHLRIQAMRPGLNLADALTHASQADDMIESGLEYAFSPRFGYLTSCPTNVGCGVRMSVMLHMPALKLAGEIEKLRRAAKQLGLAVRGYYGEGTDAAGDLYQISNQTTLGKTEEQIRHDFERAVLPAVLEYERSSRRMLLEKRRRLVEDQVFRALGLLRSARLLAPEEAMTHLSLVRLGILMGLISDLDEHTVTRLFVLVQPSHLQRLLNQEMDQQRRREARADMVRKGLGGT
ncbi:protein arginine kinase [soil metagenome]